MTVDHAGPSSPTRKRTPSSWSSEPRSRPARYRKSLTDRFPCVRVVQAQRRNHNDLRSDGAPMKRQRVGLSLVEDVQAELREEILSGDLAPGERLLVQPLSQRLHVSLSVVREALTRLAEQGLVRSAAQLGFTVTPLSLDDLADLTRVRIDIENLMIRRAIAEGDLAWEASVVAAHHHLAGTAPQLDGHLNPAWRSAHSQFHAAVAAGCQSPLLQTLRLGLFDKAELYRAWAARASGSRDVVREHRAICEAVLDRDANRATELMAAHIQLTTDLLVASAAEPGPGRPSPAQAGGNRGAS